MIWDVTSLYILGVRSGPTPVKTGLGPDLVLIFYKQFPFQAITILLSELSRIRLKHDINHI